MAILVFTLVLLMTISIASVIFVQLGNVEDEVEKELVLLFVVDEKMMIIAAAALPEQLKVVAFFST